MNLILDYESSALAAPQSFLNAMQTAINILDSTILNNITVTIQVGYNDFLNNLITGLGGSAEGGDLSGSFVSYTSLRAALASHETSTLDQTFVNSLPNTTSVNGQSGMYVPSAIEKALGIISPTAPGIDGAVGIGSGVPTADLVGVALHELTHAMGREPGAGTFDLGRYTSPGVHLFSSGSTAPASYFSIDGGVTKLADYGQNSDASDMLNSGVQGPNDPFNEFYSGSTFQGLTTVDKQQLDALGFNVTPTATGTPSATTSSLVASSPIVTADGTSSTMLTVTVKDASGNAVAGTAVTLSGSGSANSFGAISGTTDANGVFTTTLASTVVQNETITATEGNVQEQTSVSFVAGAPSATTSSLVASSPTVTADGTSTTTLTVTVEDASGHVVAGTAVTLSGSGSANSFGAISGITNANGVFTTTLASTLVQNEIITATEGSVQEHTSVSFVAPVTATIESFGSTKLVEVSSNFYLESNSSGSGPELKYGGAAVTAGEFSGWTPIGTEQTATGYEVAWKITGSNQYGVWDTDSNGNYLLNPIGIVSGTSSALESLEISFHQDLNGDGVIGVTSTQAPPVSGTIIESFGSTSLVGVGSNFYLDSNSSGSGPELKYGGAAVTAGEFGGWTPIGTEQTATGYEVAWKMTGADQYGVWATDSNGNYLSNIGGTVSGTSSALETLETSFHQDLNGDGVIGVPSSAPVPPASGTIIEAFGSTSLVGVGSNFYLDSNSTGSGPELKFGGANFVAGQAGGWTPIGTEQTATGYEVAWKMTGVDQYGVWNTDSNGNYLSNVGGIVPGASSSLETLETIFHQDLNGDGVIGVPSTPAPVPPVISGTIIESFGSTSLVGVGSNFYLDSNSTGSGPELKYGGANFVAGQAGGWTPIGTEQTATGYEVAWKMTGADQYGVWATDSNGNYLSNIGGIVSGASSALETLETSFHQDLNHDGMIGVPAATSPAVTSQGPTTAAMGMVNAIASGGGGSFVFDPNFGHVTITNDALPAGIDFSHMVFANLDALLAAAKDDGHGNTVITDATHDTLTIQKMTSQQLHTHQSDFHIV